MFLAGVGKPILTPEGILVPRLCFMRGIPIGAFPSRHLPKTGAPRGQSIVNRRASYVAGRLVLEVRPVHPVKCAYSLYGPVVQIAGSVLEPLEPANVDLCQVHCRVALDDPFSDRSARPGARRDAC